MRDVMDNEFAWELFEHTGSIESYLFYNEHKNLSMGNKTNEHNTNNGIGSENL